MRVNVGWKWKAGDYRLKTGCSICKSSPQVALDECLSALPGNSGECGIVKGAIKIIAPMPYRQRYQQSTGRDPLRCPHCQHEMGVWRIWHPTYGVIYVRRASAR